MPVFRHPDGMAFHHPTRTSPAQLRQMTADRPDDARGWSSLAMPGRLIRSLQAFREWSANLSYAMLPVLD
jgi:hypothetical protein